MPGTLHDSVVNMVLLGRRSGCPAGAGSEVWLGRRLLAALVSGREPFLEDLLLHGCYGAAQ
jgi:hypothetical protein